MQYFWDIFQGNSIDVRLNQMYTYRTGKKYFFLSLRLYVRKNHATTSMEHVIPVVKMAFKEIGVRLVSKQETITREHHNNKPTVGLCKLCVRSYTFY